MPPKSDKRSLVEQVLEGHGQYERLAPDYLTPSRFPQLDGVRWRPALLYRIGRRLLGVDIFHGDRVPKFTVQHMGLARNRLGDLDVAFLVPEGEDFNVIRQACHIHGIDIITKVGEKLVRLASEVLARDEAIRDELHARIPAWLVTSITKLARLDGRFRLVLSQFVEEYSIASRDGREAEAQLLKATFHNLLKIDERFAAPLEQLGVLRWFEREFQQEGWRDHFFHSFVNFLLGCMVIDQAYDMFEDFVRDCFSGTSDLSIEYTWLLTALFHDVGYPTERRGALEIYGDERLAEPGETEPAVLIQERKVHWKDGRGFDRARSQLVSLYEHLLLPEITGDWSADPFERTGHHALADAMESSYINQASHGVASALMMLAKIQYLARDAPDPTRQFLCRPIYLAGLSILFHDWKFRKACRESGIFSIGSRRFPLAVLLIVIDSVQDDRREEDLVYIRPDALQGLEISADTVTLRINLARLSTPELYAKFREIRDILDFVSFDGLRYQYPPELVTLPCGVSE